MSKQNVERVALVGVDFSESGDEAVARGLEWLARDPLRTLHLIHVIDPRDLIDDPERPALEAQADELARAPVQLRERAKLLALMFDLELHLAGDPERTRTHARLGPPVETLLQACVDYDADLLMVGTHGRKGIERLLLGSVAEMLVRTAHCPVIVARRKDYTGCAKTSQPDAPYGPHEHRPSDYFESRHEPITSTESSVWHPSDNGPTGFRIV